MSFRPHRDAPCWQIVRIATGEPPEADWGCGWAHYNNEAAARAALVAREGSDDLTVAQSFDAPCVGLFCDGSDCAGNEPMDFDGEGWTHCDPADPLGPLTLDDLDMIEGRDGRHYCAGCRIEADQ